MCEANSTDYVAGVKAAAEWLKQQAKTPRNLATKIAFQWAANELLNKVKQPNLTTNS